MRPRLLQIVLAVVAGLPCAVPPLLAGEPTPVADSGPALPAAPAPIALHGTWRGAPFWARLGPADQRYDGKRMLEIVCTPPEAAALGGAELIDCPFLLVDDAMRVVAYNGRGSLNRVVHLARGYQVTRQLAEGEDARQLAGALAWDLTYAPVLLACAWRRGTAPVSMRLVDLFGNRHAEALTVAWRGEQVSIAGVEHVIDADGDGRLKRLRLPGGDGPGTTVLDVAGWAPVAPAPAPAAATATGSATP